MKPIFIILSTIGLIIFICWALSDIGATAERDAAERHGQSGAIGGGYGNAGRD